MRVSHLRVTFERAYHEKFSGEIFKISKRFRRLGKPVYTLIDLNNEPIIGTFYQPELTKVNVDDSSIYEISDIIKSRKKGKQKEYLVRWKYYGPKFDSQVKASDIESF